MNRGRYVDPAAVTLFREELGLLCLSIAGDATWPDVQILRAAPLSDPEHHICILDRNGEEIAWIENPGRLDVETRSILLEELKSRYLTVIVRRVLSARNESGVCYLDVETDRGRREFVVQNVEENVRLLADGRLLVDDVDRNRIEVPAAATLDKRSAGLLASVLGD